MLTIESLRTEPDWLLESLAWPFEFDVNALLREPDRPWFLLAKDSQIDPVALDGAGGVFGTLVNGAVVFCSSEGQAGVIAESLTEAVSLLVSAPYWLDLAKFSGGGQLGEMLRAEPLLKRDLRADQPEALDLRDRILSQLGVVPTPDACRALHSALVSHQDSFRITSPYGEAFSSLFNSFTVEDNPAWRLVPAPLRGPAA